MTNDKDRPSLADDPEFLDSLLGLDRGLSGAAPVEPEPAPESPIPEESPGHAHPPALSEPVQPAPSDSIRQPDGAPEDIAPPPLPLWLLPPTSTPAPAPVQASAPPLAPEARTTRRPLLELFPPVPAAPVRPVSAPPAMRPRSRTTAPGPVAQPAVSPQDYETFYGFDDRPFGMSTDAKFFYHSASHDRAAQTLLSAIRGRTGVVVISGDDGLGKTMLCRTVMEELDRRTLVSHVTAASLSAEDLLRTLLADFGVTSKDDLARGGLRAASSRELTSALRDFLQSLSALHAGAVAILDGADHLPADVLDQVRAWADAETDLRLLQVVLVGGPGLPRRLRRKALRPLDAKVSARIELHPIAPDEIDGYIAHRLAVAGTHPRVEFDERAMTAVHRFTGGVPSEINVLCDRALVKGHRASAAVIDAAMIAEAADELDLTPPERPAAAVARRVALALGFALLVIAGAAGAAVTFSEPFGRLVEVWVRTPLR